MSELNPVALVTVCKLLTHKPEQITKSLSMLIDEKSTIPFISRYRKEVTGGLDDVALIEILDTYNDVVAQEDRRTFILESIKKLEKLTPELEKAIKAATSLNQLEDLYAPYKSKIKTKAQVATEKGLKPLAELLKTTKLSLVELEKKHLQEFVTKENKLEDFKQAVEGASDIVTEEIANNTELKEDFRRHYWNEALLKSVVKKGAEKIEDHLKYKDYFDFEQKLSTIKDPKNNFRFLALRRGANEKILSLEVVYDQSTAEKLIAAKTFPLLSGLGCKDIISNCISKAYTNYLHRSLETEIKSELKDLGDDSAIQIFSENLKNLLLQPYIGQKAILGIDPGVRTGCKVVAIDKNGNYLFDSVIYPHQPKNDTVGSVKTILLFLEKFEIEFIAIGSGTYGRETLQFLQQHIPAIQKNKVKAVLVNEDGASIYSASAIAREEFPDKDVTVRGAISIARRFQDPLAELVKLDPKSIGVGQYQHDVNPVKLKKSLGYVVEACVNHVGVDLNTASYSLLSYVSGIGPGVAKSIVTAREKLGGFKDRKELLKVSRFTEKTFEQSAGFLRIHGGPNPLDATFIHPEAYPILEKWCKTNKIKLSDLPQNKENIELLAKDKAFKTEIGEYTHADIVKCLKSATQDPRTEFEPFSYRDDIKEIKDLKIGQIYPGLVTNITQFGAFVDIGIKENALIHISQMSDTFVDNPLAVLKVGETVKGRLIEIDVDRKRISLSLKSNPEMGVKISRTSSPQDSKNTTNNHRGNTNHSNRSQSNSFKSDDNNPFAALKKLKL
jgi:protein Tex